MGEGWSRDLHGGKFTLWVWGSWPKSCPATLFQRCVIAMVPLALGLWRWRSNCPTTENYKRLPHSLDSTETGSDPEFWWRELEQNPSVIRCDQWREEDWFLFPLSDDKHDSVPKHGGRIDRYWVPSSLQKLRTSSLTPIETLLLLSL